ncbi:MAG: type II/IV secretion system protein [Planctomycetes bacterium]|nr:type II/IV secretion system protein [Planctomycetota bacterium]MBM4058554.1 type II/IV secretion system protein [Planctomycetota bacterium]
MADAFTKLLVSEGLVSAEQLAEAMRIAGSSGKKVQDEVVRLGYAPAEKVMKALARANRLKFVNLADIAVPDEIIQLLPESVARENTIFPLAESGSVLRIATCDPSDMDAQEKLRFILNREIEMTLAVREQIVEAINRHYGLSDGESADSMLQEFTDTAIDFTETAVEQQAAAAQEDNSDAPVVKLVNLIITEAVQLRASDIHIEPFEDRIRIRYRIDGRLVERDNPPRRLLGAMLSRIKILSKLDIAERRRPQDGRIKLTADGKDYDLRVSVLPTNHGQSVVMRILDKDNIRVGIRQLGLSENDFRQFKNLIRRPNGIILVTGPTGSGKTTTLYASLNELNRPDTKIITAEDPVEYYLAGINQVEIKHQIGLDFARVIRAMLRQAPNVILVGEMRDTETAQMGIQASLTGHLVFSTLHTNDAPSAVTRMIDMGVPAYLVASSVIAVLAQRLVRVNCPKCKQPFQPLDSQIETAGITPEMLQGATFMKGRGCANCQKSGYKGRLGIFELMVMTNRIRELSFQGAATQDIRRAAVSQGMQVMFQDGIQKALRGITTLDEVFRVAKKAE